MFVYFYCRVNAETVAAGRESIGEDPNQQQTPAIMSFYFIKDFIKGSNLSIFQHSTYANRIQFDE